jgi:hypothetical protein
MVTGVDAQTRTALVTEIEQLMNGLETMLQRLVQPAESPPEGE